MVRCSLAVPVDVVYDEEAGKTDKAVTALHDELKAIIVVYYLKTGMIDQKMRELHCSRQTLYNRLHHAQQRVEDFLRTLSVERAWPETCGFSRKNKL